MDNLTKEQQLEALKQVLNFLLQFDRIPGTHAVSWGDMLTVLQKIAQAINDEIQKSKTN